MIDLIIPFKNAEIFIPRLVASLAAQRDKAFRVIGVDDNSDDTGAEILQQLCDEESIGCSVLRGTSNGAGAARNLGIAAATSSYVAFVDADDYIAEDFILLSRERADGVTDIVETLFCSVDANGVLLSKSNVASHLSRAPRCLALASGLISMVAWGKLYRRQFLIDNDITFLADISHAEDHIFTLNAYKNCLSYQTVFSYLYFWCRQPGSLTNRAIDETIVQDFLTSVMHKISMFSDSESSNIAEKLALRAFSDGLNLKARIESGHVQFDSNRSERFAIELGEILVKYKTEISAEARKKIAHQSFYDLAFG